jgi:hypothetical protein
MFDRICEVGLGWAFAGRGPWAMFIDWFKIIVLKFECAYEKSYSIRGK